MGRYRRAETEDQRPVRSKKRRAVAPVAQPLSKHLIENIPRYHKNVKKERESMGNRKAMKPKKDKRVFTQTANSVKKINVKPKLSRGGIRL